jgi:hypothetical protein
MVVPAYAEVCAEQMFFDGVISSTLREMPPEATTTNQSLHDVRTKGQGTLRPSAFGPLYALWYPLGWTLAST